uniref:SET domain-containing protein n=1 Tax=Seriola lalandi dorsalis TaxID=1841481 RepID=A0A3B4X4A7_SERLL
MRTTMENVAVFDSPGKGRGLKATKEFWAGDVIFSEPSLAAVVFDRYSEKASCGCATIASFYFSLVSLFTLVFEP